MVFYICIGIAIFAMLGAVTVLFRSGKRKKQTLEYIQTHGLICQKCHQEGPVVYKKFTKMLTITVFIWKGFFEGVICDNCAKEINRSYTLFTFILGWPGVFLPVSLWTIAENLFEMRVHADSLILKYNKSNADTAEF